MRSAGRDLGKRALRASDDPASCKTAMEAPLRSARYPSCAGLKSLVPVWSKLMKRRAQGIFKNGPVEII